MQKPCKSFPRPLPKQRETNLIVQASRNPGPLLFSELKIEARGLFSQYLLDSSLHRAAFFLPTRKDLASGLEADDVFQAGGVGPGVFLLIGCCGEQNAWVRASVE